MKIRPLPEIDLARIAPLSRDEKRRALEQIRLGHPPYSYGPVRASMSDVLNVQSDLIGPMPRTPWEKIAQAIQRKSHSDAEEQANLRVAAGLFNFVEEKAGGWASPRHLPSSIRHRNEGSFLAVNNLAVGEPGDHSLLGPASGQETYCARPSLRVLSHARTN